MKILMLTAAMDIGGAETHILELSRELVRRGHSVTVASNGGVYVEALESSGVRHLTAPLHTKNPMDMGRAKKILSNDISEQKYDVIHAHARIPGFVGEAVAKKHGVPFVTTFHGVYNPVWYLRLLTRVGKYTLAVSDDVREYLKTYYNTPDESIAITVNGIDTNTFDRDSEAKSPISEMADGECIVCVTRLDRESAWHVFRMIEAMPEIAAKYPAAKLIIVGGGDVLDEVQRAAGEINDAIGEKIVVTGSRTDIAQILKCAKIFVGVSRAAMEAMACRVPVILSGAQGHLGIFTPELEETAVSTNFCCRDRDVAGKDTLGAVTAELLSYSDEKLREMGDYNRDVVMRLYSVGRMADDAETLYKRILGK